MLERNRCEALHRILTEAISEVMRVGNLPDATGELGQAFETLVDNLALYIATEDLSYKYLAITEYIRVFAAFPEVDRPALVRAYEALARSLITASAPGLDSDETSRIEGELGDVVRVASVESCRALDVLLFADCLSRDVMKFVAPFCLEDGITVRPTLLYTKNPAEQRNTLKGMADRKFDLICYSPFTYGFSPRFARLSETRQAIATGGAIRIAVEDTMAEVTKTLDLLTGLFDCPIIVHNSANVRRHDSRLRERAKNLMTRRTRRLAGRQVNASIGKYVADKNSTGVGHLHLLDEDALRREHGDSELGRLLFDSGQDEPVYAMGRWVAEAYRDYMFTRAYLSGKKLVVCDLDNTLWEGLIGEGAITHHLERQMTLRKLRERGVILAICSKNDARNVHWDGAYLGEDDFVSVQINWDPKATNLNRLQKILNLKSKDFVFIDDRADERELVARAMPDVHVMDATVERTWKLLELWSRLLPSQVDADRTRLYQERARRESCVEELRASREDEGSAFAQLEIRVAVRAADRTDLARVVELINRTNQFNLCGSRTNPAEVEGWLACGNRRILVVEAADKFGSMGLVSVAVAHLQFERVEVPVFVLSCRVFGYGIEKVVINSIKRLARSCERDGGVPIAGQFIETAHNDPCRNTYKENGFWRDGEHWVFKGGGEVVDPPWLELLHDSRSLAPLIPRATSGSTRM